MKMDLIKKWIWVCLFFISFETFSQTTSSFASQRLSQAIRFPTISYSDSSLIRYNAYKEFLDFLKKSYPLTHQHLQPQIINRYSLLFCWKGSDSSILPMLYTAHYDVVPVDTNALDKWKEGPFSGKINEEFIYGRGAVDDKLVIIGLMESCERLLKENFKPQRTIYIAFGHDEEIGGLKGAYAISRYLLQKNISFEAIIDEGSAIGKNILPGIDKLVAFIGTAEKGDMNVLLSIKDKGGHSAAPSGEMAITMLSKAVTRLRRHPMRLHLTPLTKTTLETLSCCIKGKSKFAIKHQWLFKKIILKKMAKNNISNAIVRTVITPTIIRGGIKENILPGYASVNLNARILHGDSVESVLHYIQKTIRNNKIKVQLKGPHSNPSTISSDSSGSYIALKKLIEEQFNDIIVTPVVCIGATDSRHYSVLSENIFRFIPFISTAEDAGMIHGTNERVSLVAFEKALGFYYELLKRMDRLK